jgi:protein FAM50
MADPATSRFTQANKTTQERLSTNTVGLVALSDFRKRRAEVIEQQEREAREVHLAVSAGNTPDRSLTATPNNLSDGSEAEKQSKKKKKRLKTAAASKLSFGGEGDDEEEEGPVLVKPKAKGKPAVGGSGEDGSSGDSSKQPTGKLVANAAVGVVPRSFTKSALRREAAEREALRKEFLAMQTAAKATEIALPFVFYDGASIPGGVVRVKKGDFVWVFLDKSRKVGAELGVGGDKNANARREWARVGVDDLMLVRGTIIIPHVSASESLNGERSSADCFQHYEFYFFMMNKTVGPDHRRLFNYTADAPAEELADKEKPSEAAVLSNPSKDRLKNLRDINELEGASDDPSFTKVVDRRWYERHKHIYPASIWQEFDPEKDYQTQVRRDPGGNAFFFSK